MRGLCTYHILRWKCLLSVVMAMLALGAHSQEFSETWIHRIEVRSGQEEVEGKAFYTYSIVAYEVKDIATRNGLIELSKAWVETADNRAKIIAAMQLDLPELKAQGYATLVNSETLNKAHRLRIILSFMNGKHIVNPNDFPKGDAAVRAIVYDLGLNLNRSVVSAQIVKATSDLSALESKHKTCINQKAGLEKRLSNIETKLSRIDKENADLSLRLAKEKSKAASLESVAKSSTSTTLDLKKYDAAVEYVTKVEEQILNSEQEKVKIRNEISEINTSIPGKQEEIIALSDQLNDQKNLVVKLKAKLDEIQ